ncbi:hypothetical protein AAX26_01325 [Aliarcobacter thereius]|uniref:Cytochrome c n=2 Tax=Aliarcobacter thereius TaxID=544718 RepID=A0A1C0B6S0_9BACT|nr:c-type cytochrome [Aliarcobacter thereius]OCL87017.1 hypothetical protein AAX26_01325 [Aliarcobacter thereius]OCL95949.1 hypothetical protein AA347_01438 [Aliarcobacter thereius LMG 24486]OCL99274.1 hypothetical protein AAX29_01086 [Aliarcobacter thereius]QBF16079.1 hypothetical protein ATH_1012 [Aliarcobacter thereius LMG 24486]TLS71861.1 cytochrome c [Aliarcobacter thereius]
MKYLFIFLFFNIFLIANEQDNLLFITKPEYGKMLYENPRGIGCNTCHGDKAEGKKIVQFKHILKEDKYLCTLYTPSIKDVSYEVFKDKVNQRKNKKKIFKDDEICEKLIYNSNIMPTYHLTEEEIESIYYYIKSIRK